MESQVRQNFHREGEAAINCIVNLELRASYVFMSMKPEQDEWGNSLEVLQHALQLEKTLNHALLDLHKVATEQNDPHLCDFLESDYLEEQVKAIKQLGDHLTNLKYLGVPQNGMGKYLFDKHTSRSSQTRCSNLGPSANKKPFYASSILYL
ncbi:ferritin, higher subunit-like isoform X3 [Dermochelys coriacea]|uniref:ferritin, higher subunit-like isoform X3 n=1 Tax=Dermochelys coriacea TaxID=27794 RepID=UPI001CA99AAB|nr:ferritin, higher subunit-like isoform X3 [Dermochelys coriacea]